MRKNLGIKILSSVMISTVAVILITTRHSTKIENPETDTLKVSINTELNDNIRDVLARLIETEKKIQYLEKRHKEALNKNQNPDPTHELQSSIESLKQELSALKNKTEENGDLSDRSTDRPPDHSAQIKDIDKLLMKNQLDLQEKSYWEKLNPKDMLKKSIASEAPNKIAYYTIPAGSDLNKVTLLSALIGEVPSDGKLMQPLFPFSAIISRGDLMASNGIALPSDIAGMKISGYAIGVGSFLDNISCVRAYVTSALFTFQDGHFVTIGSEQMTNTTDLVNNDSLGYLTNSFGNPCIHGTYFTNAPRVLTAMMASGGMQGIGNALSQWQMSYTNNANGTSSSPTGSFLPFAGGNALSEGTLKASDWLEKRIQGSFDMVFVPASYKNQPNQVSLHITQTLKIDKELNGRTLNDANTQTVFHDHSLM